MPAFTSWLTCGRRFDSQPPANLAAVSIMVDGSVLVSHGGLELGQGLSTKVKQVSMTLPLAQPVAYDTDNIGHTQAASRFPCSK